MELTGRINIWPSTTFYESVFVGGKHYFFMIDISLVNRYILFQEYCKQQESNENFNRLSKYEFRENVVVN